MSERPKLATEGQEQCDTGRGLVRYSTDLPWVRLGLLASLLCLWPGIGPADIYRYQDQQGNWHFTDDPPPDADADKIHDIVETSKARAPSYDAEDLVARLQAGFESITPIARATLAVVAVKGSPDHQGSGFFCSENGYILTNRRVVRPAEAGQLDQRESALDGRAGELETLEVDLQGARAQLQLMQRDLEGYERVIAGAGDDRARSWATDAHARLSERYQAGKAKLAEMEEQVSTVKTDLRKSRRELSWTRNTEALTTSFGVVLKDGTELQAALVATSPAFDLALLKIDGYRTPSLRLEDPVGLAQGMRVFAIGSPLGMQDSVTSGVVTQITSEQIVTDAQILPSNGGGPLITETGEVIGVNVATSVASGESVFARGSGKAIPISVVRQEFPEIPSAGGTSLPQLGPESL